MNLSINKKYCALIVCCLIGCLSSVYAQWDAQISQYWATKTFYNPAFAGEKSNLDLAALHRQQWMGIDNAPQTTLITGSMPLSFLGRVHGVGATFMSESIGLFQNSAFSAQYVYKMKFKNNYLNVGVQAGFLNIEFDAGNISIPDDQESEFSDRPTGGEGGSTLDAAIGVSWVGPKYYVGLSMTHALEPSFDIGESHTSYVASAFYLTGGYNIQFSNPLYELQPSILYKTDGVVSQLDVTARLMYNDMFNGGVSWRKDDGFVFLLGVKIKNFDAGYAYDLSTSAISKVSSGSHEIFLRYNMPINLTSGKKKGHKSVRIL